MNSKENRTLYLFLIAVINVFSIIAGIYIGMSEVLVNSKYGFITIIFMVACFADCLLMKYRDERIGEAYRKRLDSAEADARKYKDRVLEIAEERDNLNAGLEYYTSGAIKEEYDFLKQKCEMIEGFRNSFPCKIADGYILYNIMRTNLQVGRSSTWQIVGDYHGDLWEVSIVRPHTQSYKEMLTLVAATAEPNQITGLNQSETLLWE